MPLADTADRRIATECPERIQVVRQQQGLRARPRCGKRRLGAGMAAANNDHIETGGIEHGHETLNGLLQRTTAPPESR